MKNLKKTISRLALLPLVAATLSVAVISEAPAQAQRFGCRAYSGVYWLGSGDRARLGSTNPRRPIPASQRINIRSRATTRSEVLHYGFSGDPLYIIDNVSTDSDCFNWFYVEFQSSGARGWVRGDLIKNF